MILNKKLEFEFVPDGCWKSNLRTILSKRQWDYVKKDAKERAGGKCMICGKKTAKLDAHEKWNYDLSKGVQVLEDVIAVCKDCHAVIHMGRTQLKGDEVRAEKHYMKVNNCSYVQYRKELGLANELHQKRNQVSEWAIDISWLKRFVVDEKAEE